MNVLKKIKAKEESIAMQNKHIGGCILSSPGTPNQTTWYFEMGTVNENETLKCDAIWEPQYYNGRVINYNYELQIQPSTAKA